MQFSATSRPLTPGRLRRREVDGHKRHLHLATGVNTLTKADDTVLLALKLHRLSRGRTSAIGHLVTATTDPRLTSHAATADWRKNQRDGT